MDTNFKKEANEVVDKQQINAENADKILSINIKKLNENAVIPTYTKADDMGMDLTAISVEYDEEKDCYVYHTGLSFEVPKGHGMLIFPRSSNRKTNAYMTNHVGILDAGYRGELLVCFKNRTDSYMNNIANSLVLSINSILRRLGLSKSQLVGVNLNHAPYKVGNRIAQIVILPYPQISFTEVKELSETERGTNGHGSTGD